MALTNPIKDHDWRSVRQAIQQLSHLRLGPDSSPTFAGITLSGFTQGSVLFAGSGGTVSEDNSNLFWDDTNIRLGIGDNTPSTTLDVVGNFQLQDSSNNIIVFADQNEFYITASLVIPIEAGMPIGLLLALTYASP
jgi:hypothetical protein